MMAAWQEFCLNYAGYIIALLCGILLAAAIWFRRHPEDFYWVEEDEAEQAVEIEEIDHATME